VCKNGADPATTPPTCIAETDLATALLTLDRLSETSFRLSGTVPVRLQNAPVEYTFFGTFTGSITLTGNAPACPGQNETFLPVPLTITFDTAAAPGNALSLEVAIDPNGTTIQDGLSVCGGMAGFADLLKPAAAAAMTQSAQASVTSLVEAQLCLPGPTCPAGSTPDQNGLCRYSSGLCVARGIDSSGTLLAACLPHPGGI
jgi:hypothetical protein